MAQRVQEPGVKVQVLPRESSGQDVQSTRAEFNELLNAWYPPTLRQVLQLDPSLLQNPVYLRAYPKLEEFLIAHPEVAHNPTFFVGMPLEPNRRRGVDLEPLAAAAAFLGFVGFVIWVIRSIIGHRRWLRVSKLQTEAQAKILERFANNEELIQFIQTPAGRRFVDASSTPLEPRSLGAPVGRILWSVQVGLVLLFAGIGLEVLGRSTPLESEDLSVVFHVIGGIVIALGVGFLFSGLASYFLSRRFGLFDQVPPNEGGPAQTPS
jgi:hypothetical protein